MEETTLIDYTDELDDVPACANNKGAIDHLARNQKQTALAISTIEAEYVSAGKARQQALWMKQALIDYDVRLDDVPIMRDNNGVIDLSNIFGTVGKYRTATSNYSDEGQMFVEFVIQNQLFSYSLENFAQILDVPCEGACVFTNRWRLDELEYGIPSDGPYQTNPPSIKDIISSIRIDREGQVRRIRHEEEIDVHDYQILTREIILALKPLEDIIFW
ncbi:hypothetical protein Tco_1225378 [Tanacetum coccineum]